LIVHLSLCFIKGFQPILLSISSDLLEKASFDESDEWRKIELSISYPSESEENCRD
jgi:hypothetical protein